VARQDNFRSAIRFFPRMTVNGAGESVARQMDKQRENWYKNRRIKMRVAYFDDLLRELEDIRSSLTWQIETDN
jgi:hypothetical protein